MARSLCNELFYASSLCSTCAGVISTIVVILFISSQTQVVKSSIENVDYVDVLTCPSPISGVAFAPRNERYCIYAICYTDKQFGKVVYYNYGELQYTDQIEEAASLVCANNALSNPLYGGGWLKTKRNETMNLFFMCCKDCRGWKGLKVSEFRLRLKNMYFARNYLNVKRVYDMIDTDDHQGFYYKDRFILFIENRDDATVVNLPNCLSTNFTTVASLINIPVCWAKANWRSHCEACGDEVDTEYLNIKGDSDTGLNRRLGPFNELRSRELEHIFCNYSHNENRCEFWDNFTTYNAECCCYGNETERTNCQLSITSGGRAVDGAKTNCAVGTWFSSDGKGTHRKVKEKLEHEEGNAVKAETRSGNDSLDTFINLATSTEQCETLLVREHDIHLESPKQALHPVIYAHKREQLQQLGMCASLNRTPSCETLAINDDQLHDIYLQQCYPGLPLNRMCPMRYNDWDRGKESSSIICCCNDESFCNHKGDMRARTMYSPKKMCQYNNRYQELVNKYAIRIDAGEIACMVHFANAEAMQSLTAGSKTSAVNASVLNVLPGAPLLPIDHSYALLNGTDSCGYIEANVHWKYLQTRQCGDDATINTEYLPLKLYVCRCKTPYINGVLDAPCDIELGEEIAAKESEDGKKLTGSVCAIYEQEDQTEAGFNATLIGNRVSSACLIQVNLNDDGSSYTIKGDVARGTVVNTAKVRLGHNPYASLRRTGDWTSLCSSENGSSYCFCRSYQDGVACNNRMAQVKVTLRTAYRTMLVGTRTRNRMNLDPQSRKANDEGCLRPGGLLTIRREGVRKISIYSECLHEGAQRKVKGAQCRRGANLSNKCVLRNREVVCCCMTVDECKHVKRHVINIYNKAFTDN